MPAIPLFYAEDRRSFRATFQAECGTSSGVVDRAWLNIVPTWGSCSVTVTCLDGKGGVTTPQWVKSIPNNRLDGIEVPSGTRAITVEGAGETQETIVAVRLVEKAR